MNDVSVASETFAVSLGNVTERHDPASRDTGSLREAGEGGRTLDIHVGNVTLYH